MFASRNLSRHCLRTIWSLSSLFESNPYRNAVILKDVSSSLIQSNVMQQPSISCEDSFSSFPSLSYYYLFNRGSRAMSTSKGRSMRSKVENRMRKESGKTLREIRRAKKLKKKLMTDEERLIYNLKRAKKKVALLLQKLKKYELPELPQPVHDPEILTPEQLQAYKKIGFKNKNYVPVGVRGVFGGVVQNMHMHWKFHETVQVCCDNFPKEKIKEMATMIARLSGGIVINVHNVKTIIMFRGRNYRQPKNLIPLNTLTKRKALFKARFEQALESQKLNIKKIEQQLRRMGVNPEDPVAMASIQRVASTFFNAIDKREGSPYVFHGDKRSEQEPDKKIEDSEPADDSDQEELDRFISEIEDAADKEWAAEEAAEKEEYGRIRYWNREEFGGRLRRPEISRNEDFNNGFRGPRDKIRLDDSDDEEEGGEGEWDSDDGGNIGNHESDDDDGSDETPPEFNRSKVETGKRVNVNRYGDLRVKKGEEGSESENMFSDLENTMWDSDDEGKHSMKLSRVDAKHNYRSSSDEEDGVYGKSGNAMWKSDDEENGGASEAGKQSNGKKGEEDHGTQRRMKTRKEKDEEWDSD